MKKQKIEDIFSSMEDFSSIPPPELWANIEEKLDKPKKKKRAILWWSAAACLLLGLMVPTVLHFTSNPDALHNGPVQNNQVVLDENKKETKDTNPTLKNGNNTDLKRNNTNTSLDNNLNNSGENQVEETAVAQSDSKTNTNSAILNSKTPVAKRNNNLIVAEKNTVAEKENQVNSFSASKKLTSEKNSKTPVVAEKNYNIYQKQNSFNTGSRNYFPDTNEKKNADRILAEKTFKAGKSNGFNSGSKGLAANSIFEKSVPNSNNIALNPSTPMNNGKLNSNFTDRKEATYGITKSENALAENVQKNNSKFKDVLSKQDSVQLAELQNLEKGIVTPTPETKKEKEEKLLKKGEKWALQLFAGVANSENYKNDKTLGNVNDSKQGSTYGVKTKYNISKKWAVGSGFKINELGQSVANVSYISTKNTAFLGASDVMAQQNYATPHIASNTTYVLVSNNAKNTLKSDNIQTGNLDQNLRYFEMPLEVSYSVLSKNKFGINLNTGGFVGKLISNNVALDGNSIGKNVDANDFVYGSTLSSTVQYRVYKKTNVFVEPAMNYYINPLNNQSFNQLQWGLNFGLNVSF